MNGEVVQPEFHDSVTIYFSDIVGFTNFCSQQSAGEIVLLLNELYRSVDHQPLSSFFLII